jgi:hypothetical protein
MRRILVIASVAALAVALVATVAYAASVKHFAGSVDRGGKVHFDALRDHGKYTRAGLFDFDRIPVKCDQGNDKAFISTQNVVDVKQRKFSYKFNFGDDGKARVSGKFNRKGNKAKGVVNISDFSPGDTSSTGCTTNGPRDWKATK